MSLVLNASQIRRDYKIQFTTWGVEMDNPIFSGALVSIAAPLKLDEYEEFTRRKGLRATRMAVRWLGVEADVYHRPGTPYTGAFAVRKLLTSAAPPLWRYFREQRWVSVDTLAAALCLDYGLWCYAEPWAVIWPKENMKGWYYMGRQWIKRMPGQRGYRRAYS